MRLSGILFAAAFACTKPAPPAPTQPAPESVLVLGMSLELEGCTLRYGAQDERDEADLGMPPPCRFAKGRDGGIKIEQTQVGPVVLALTANPLPTPPGEPPRCDGQARAIRVSGGEVSLSRLTGRSLGCGYQTDAKAFHIFGADTVPLPKP